MEKKTYDLHAYLKLRDIGVKEFADMVGCSPQAISNYINWRRKPSLEMICRIEKATKGKVTSKDLLGYWEAKKDHG